MKYAKERISKELQRELETRECSKDFSNEDTDGEERYAAFIQDNQPFAVGDFWMETANSKKNLKTAIDDRFRQLREYSGKPDLIIVWDRYLNKEMDVEVKTINIVTIAE
jgi:hypothetical protein